MTKKALTALADAADVLEDVVLVTQIEDQDNSTGES